MKNEVGRLASGLKRHLSGRGFQTVCCACSLDLKERKWIGSELLLLRRVVEPPIAAKQRPIEAKQRASEAELRGASRNIRESTLRVFLEDQAQILGVPLTRSWDVPTNWTTTATEATQMKGQGAFDSCLLFFCPITFDSGVEPSVWFLTFLTPARVRANYSIGPLLLVEHLLPGTCLL